MTVTKCIEDTHSWMLPKKDLKLVSSERKHLADYCWPQKITTNTKVIVKNKYFRSITFSYYSEGTNDDLLFFTLYYYWGMTFTRKIEEFLNTLGIFTALIDAPIMHKTCFFLFYAFPFHFFSENNWTLFHQENSLITHSLSSPPIYIQSYFNYTIHCILNVHKLIKIQWLKAVE